MDGGGDTPRGPWGHTPGTLGTHPGDPGDTPRGPWGHTPGPVKHRNQKRRPTRLPISQRGPETRAANLVQM